MRQCARLLWLMLGLALAAAAAASPSADWPRALANELARIEADTPGSLGVYVKHLGDGHSVGHDAERLWYLASTVKVPVAIALLQLVEEGVLSLDETLTLQRSDYVDGAGDLLWQQPGTRYSLRQLLQKMLENSDSTATDMLIRRIGVQELNRRIRASMVEDGFEPFTTILQVRYDAYGELHPSVRQLSNMDFIRLKAAAPGRERLQALLTWLPVGEPDLRTPNIDAAFERYYARGLNSGRLDAFGHLLEKLVRGELLSAPHTALVLDHMQNISTGDNRLKAGLPAGVPFAQKTGTQIGRACNVGIVRPASAQLAQTVIVAACSERHGPVSAGEAALAAVGEALVRSGAVH